MANLTLASAVINAARTAIALTIGSTTTVTDPLLTTAGTYITGLSITIDGQAGNIGNVAVPGASSNVLSLPLLSSVAQGQKVIITSTSSNLKDSAGTPLLLTNQTLSTVSFIQSSLQTSMAALFSGDPTIALLQAGTYGQVYWLGMNDFVVLDVGNQFPLIFFQATMIGTNNLGLTNFAKLLAWNKGAFGIAGIPSLPASARLWATPSQVQTLFTNDTLITYLQAGNFGQVVPQGQGNISNWVIYALDNVSPVATVQAVMNYPTGTFQTLLGYQQATGIAIAPSSQSQSTPAVGGQVTSTGALSSVAMQSSVTIASCTTNNTTAITGANLTTGNGVSVGMFVYGPGIPAGAYIVSMVSGTSITISAAATNAATESLVIGASLYTVTKYCTVTAAQNNTGAIWINNSTSWSATGVRLGPSQSINLPVGTQLWTITPDFVNANDYLNFIAL